jgi:hypothetical protein
MSKKNTYSLTLLAAILLLFATTGLFFSNFTHLKQRGDFHVRREDHPNVDVEKIADWMTFEYLNRSFNLPLDYLQKDLGVTNSHYPNLTLRREATLRKQNPTVFVSLVKISIKKYQIETSITPQ